MFVKKSFKDRLKKSCLSVSPNFCPSKYHRRSKKHLVSPCFLLLMAFASLSLTSCSTIGGQLTSAAEFVKADVQTQHDENFRMRAIRKALKAQNIAEAEQTSQTLYAPHWKCIASLEIAAVKFQKDKPEALAMAHESSEAIWEINDPNKRAMALLALLRFELETSKDLPAAKKTIEQADKTIEFITNDPARQMRRYGELEALQAKHNHLLSR